MKMTIAWRIMQGISSPFWLWVGWRAASHYWATDHRMALLLALACIITALSVLESALDGGDWK